MLTFNFSRMFVAALLGFALLGSLNQPTASAQDTPIDPGGPTLPVDPQPTPQNPTTGGGGGSVTENNTPVDIENSAELDFGGSDEDNRNQGFIGATGSSLAERTFIGAASPSFGQLAEGATFGGGVNGNSTARVPSGAGGGGGGGRGGFGGAGGFGGVGQGVTVIRQNLRSRIVPSFASPKIAPRVTINQFKDNLSRQPSARSLTGRFQVSIENKTATLTGSVGSQADADRLVRQLRLQPGVYKINNRLQVSR